MAVRMERKKGDVERLMDRRIKVTTIKTPKTRTTRIHNLMIVIRNNKMAAPPVAIRITLQVPIQIPLIPRKKEIQNPKGRQSRRLLTLVTAAMAAMMMITVPMATVATPLNPLQSLKSKVHPVAAAALRASQLCFKTKRSKLRRRRR